MGWTVYVEAILKRFGAMNEDLMARLKNLKYESSMKEYQSKFEQLLSQADNTESQYVNMFIARFPTGIEMTVRMFRPKTLADTFKMHITGYHPALEKLLQEVEDVFVVPSNLPPQRDID
ncbi:gypsy/ty3 retroelement polyprotein [Tanacetum coccineum]